jgi:CheY-like chemotaxis protein
MASEVLVVDDEDGVRDLLKIVLQMMDLQVREARDGLEAMEQVGAHTPALIILDLMMPRMDGLEVLQRLKSNPATERIPVVLFTAFQVTQEQARMFQLEPWMILRKGNMNLPQLREIIGKALNGGAEPTVVIVKPDAPAAVPTPQPAAEKPAEKPAAPPAAKTIPPPPPPLAAEKPAEKPASSGDPESKPDGDGKDAKAETSDKEDRRSVWQRFSSRIKR